MMSHINFYARSLLNDKPPYLLFTAVFSQDIASLFGISPIDPEDVTLTEALMKTDIK